MCPPPGLVNAPPTQPGEIRFASKSLRRRSGLVLVVALTREEAEERHRTRQDYVLAMRRPDESLLVVRHHTGWSPHDPERSRNSYRHFHVELHGSEGRFLHASIDEEIERPRVLRMWSIDVYRMFGHRNIWNVHNDTRARTITVHDYRHGSDGYTERPMTDAEFELCEFAEPEFEDFNELWRRVETFLAEGGSRPVARRDGILRCHSDATALWRH